MQTKVYQEVLNTKDKNKDGVLGCGGNCQTFEEQWTGLQQPWRGHRSSAVFQGLKEKTVSGKCYNLLKYCVWNITGSFSDGWELRERVFNISILKECLREFSVRKEALRKDFRDIWEEGHGEIWVSTKGSLRIEVERRWGCLEENKPCLRAWEFDVALNHVEG